MVDKDEVSSKYPGFGQGCQSILPVDGNRAGLLWRGRGSAVHASPAGYAEWSGMAAGRPLIGASGNINHLVSPDLKLEPINI